MKGPAIVIILIIQAGFLFAQDINGTYEFLNLPVGARVAGLGGVLISSTDSDVNMFLSNPAILDSSHHNHLSWSHLSYYSDIRYNSLAYAWSFKRLGVLGFGVQHLGYGEIDSFDAAGNDLGEVDANETAIVVTHSRSLGLFTLGTSMKWINSNVATYTSRSLAFDFGGTFDHPGRELQVALLFKNLGFVLSDFTRQSAGSLPFDVQLGMTFKPEHMPFRISLTLYDLTKDSGYEDAGLNAERPSTLDELFRHLNIGTEIVFSKNFNLRVGYNHLVRRELQIEQKKGLTGLSMGALVKIKMFELAYTFTTYHIESGRSYFTISSNLNRILKKKSII